jgi:predicted ATPase
VTFLFTDIEGSTRRWEANPEAMRAELAAHDEILRLAIEAHGGWLFKHTGDGVCAAFGSARAAVDAAMEAQRALGLPVRMGVATGEAHERDGDYFGPVLNRAARVMAAGHGGQILLAASTASVVDDVGLVDLGEYRLRDLSGPTHLFQVCGEGLATRFPAPRTLDSVPGNLPVQFTSFVGRDMEVKELTDVVLGHRLVTLTGVGGVGKTRLALHVAAELAAGFRDGVWLIELAPVGDAGSVPDAVATALGITPQAGLSVTAAVAAALSSRRVLVVMDNCEHVLEAAVELVETILARAATVTVLATSREPLGVPAEQLWAVPPLGVDDGIDSDAAHLFVDRAQAVKPDFVLGAAPDAEAVAEICRQVDGIALAIELAATRMLSMSPQDVSERLGDRFRLLAGSRRGLPRHQTLRNTVQWSYDLLDDDERFVLGRCSVFAGGFDVAAVSHLCHDRLDEYAVLDQLDSLVRKSLVTAEPVAGHVRYGLLETIRQFAEEQLTTTGSLDAVKDRHARYFADEAIAHLDMWDGPRHRVAIDWVDTEFANLRAGFRWAADRGDLDTAVAIAAHTTYLGYVQLRYESVGWCTDILEAATAADVRQLPRLYAAASACTGTGQPAVAIGYARTAAALASDPRYEPFDPGVSGHLESAAYLYSGQIDQMLQVVDGLVAQPGLAHVVGLVGRLLTWPVLGRLDEARAIADATVTAARAHGNPFWIGSAIAALGRAIGDADPARALEAQHEALAIAREHRVGYVEAIASREAASLEARHGDPRRALSLLQTTLVTLHRFGDDVGNLLVAFGDLAVLFDRLERPEIAATLYGASRRHGDIGWATDLPAVVDHLRSILGETRFDELADVGAAMAIGDAVSYAQHQMQLADQSPVEPRQRPGHLE